MKITHKGYTVIQDETSHHITLSAPDGAQAHFTCNRPQTEEELRSLVTSFPDMLRIMRERRGAHA